jgi:hypothetical protein
VHVFCGAAAVAWGAFIIASKLFDIGAQDVNGNAAYEFGKNVGSFAGPALVVVGLFHVYRGIQRSRGVALAPVNARQRIRNLLVAVVLFIVVLLLAPAVPDADNRFEDRRAPYSYKYPGDWELGDAQAILNTFPWMSEVSQIGRSDHNAGVSVSTAAAGSVDAGVDGFAEMIAGQGGSVVERGNLTAAGLTGVKISYDMPAARHDGSVTILSGEQRRFLIWCQWESDPASAQEGCAKVLDTLRIK